MLDLCKYKDVLGRPGQGAHSLRIMNIAVVDVVLTILAAYIVSVWTKYSFYHILLFLFILGIISHRVFCVKTTVDQLIAGFGL